MNIYKPYTYLIGWTKHNMWYYGVRYAKNCHPNDFWKEYFTSSNYVKDFRKFHGEPDIIEIRKVFEDREDAIRWEQKVLLRMKVVKSNHWLNRMDKHNFYNKGYTSEYHKISVAKSNKNRVISKETREKLKNNAIEMNKNRNILGENNPNYGKRWSEEKKKDLSNKLKGMHKGRIVSEETKEKQSIARSKYWERKHRSLVS